MRQTQREAGPYPLVAVRSVQVFQGRLRRRDPHHHPSVSFDCGWDLTFQLKVRHELQARRMSSPSLKVSRDHRCWAPWKHCQSSTATAAGQPNSLVNDHSAMHCWWLSGLFLLPICALALEISYEDGQPAECRRDRVTSLFQCSDPGRGKLLLNCLGDQIRAIRFYLKKGDQVVPRLYKPNDVQMFKLTRNNDISLDEWSVGVATSDWAFLRRHSLQQPVPMTFLENEIQFSPHSPEDVFAVEVQSFKPIGFLVETFQAPSKCNPHGPDLHGVATCLSVDKPRSSGPLNLLLAHPSWTAFGILFITSFSLVAVGSLKRCRRFNRREASKPDSGLAVVV